MIVEELIKGLKKEHLHLEILAGRKGLQRKIKTKEIQRPGLALAGNFDYFQKDTPLIFGKTEITYLKKLDPAIKDRIVKKIFSYPLPFILITRTLNPDKRMITKANARNIPLLRTQALTFHAISRLNRFLEIELAPRTTIQGVLMDLYGIGTLIVGESGIGKSECALELIKRGHRLITDDLVHIVKQSNNQLIGFGTEPLSNYMELRGIGIIDVGSVFGAGAIRRECRISLVVRLEAAEKMGDYERLGMGQKYTNILKVKVPEVVIPVRPGRNLAVILEVAAMNQRIHNRGLFPARELDKKLVALMKKKSQS